MKISKWIGLDEKIEVVVRRMLAEEGTLLFGVADIGDDKVEALGKDVYANMQSIEEFKYKLVEMETQLNNLNTFVKSTLPEGGG